jgi:hypothetical protein
LYRKLSKSKEKPWIPVSSTGMTAVWGVKDRDDGGVGCQGPG